MSRIGLKPINIPSGVTVTPSKDKVSVKGPKGELHQAIDPERHKSLHGLYRALIANMIEGVSKGYKHQLELVGVGYKATAQANVLELSLGYSHNIFLAVPSEIKVQAVQEKGQNPTIILEGIDKQLLGQISAKLKSLRKTEPYKGKGVRFTGEYVRRKAGKAASK
jgi:large subunit ribosomal protein L6